MSDAAVDQSSNVFTEQRRAANPAAVSAPVAPEQLPTPTSSCSDGVIDLVYAIEITPESV